MEYEGSRSTADASNDPFEAKKTGRAVATIDHQVLDLTFALYVAGAAKSPEEGLRMANENIDSGAASRKLAEFVEASQKIAPTTKA